MIYHDETIISGDFFDGEPIFGQIITPGYQTYNGPIKNRQPHGDGKFVLENGNSFQAYFNEGIIDSNGILTV